MPALAKKKLPSARKSGGEKRPSARRSSTELSETGGAEELEDDDDDEGEEGESVREGEKGKRPAIGKKRSPSSKKPEPATPAAAGGDQADGGKEKLATSARGNGKVSNEEGDTTPMRHKPVVEDPTTGRFRHAANAASGPPSKRSTTAARSSAAKSEASGDGKATEEAPPRPATEAEKYRLFLRSLEDSATALFTSCAGLLGGMSLLLFIFAYSVSGSKSFLRLYSPIASACQHTFFVLTSIACVGAFAKTSRDRRLGWRGRDLALPAIDSIATVLYVIAFAFTLANTPVDDVIDHAEQRLPSWYDNPLLLDGSFDTTLRRWHGLNIIRLLCCLISWLLVSIFEPILVSKHPPASAIHPR